MKVCAIVVNYKTSTTAIETIKALYCQITQYSGSQILIVDNDSQDNSLEIIYQFVKINNWQRNVKVLDAKRNGGFGAGNNFAIRYGLSLHNTPEYFLLINPDAIPEKNLVESFINLLDSSPETGIVGGTIKRPDGERKISAFRFPNIVDEFLKGLCVGAIRNRLSKFLVAPHIINETCPVDWVSGACLMIRSRMIREIGLFDETFFLYYEEIDLCRRAKKHDWKIYHHVNSGIVHICGMATGIQNTHKRTPKYLFHSRKYYFCKHHGILYLWLANILFIIGYVFNYLRHLLLRRKVIGRPLYFLDFIRYSF